MRHALGTLSEFSDTARVSPRPGWTVALLGLVACGELPEPAWLLTEEPRVLAFRVEVTEPGPLSYGFLPIPADRIRSQPLPGDTIDVSPWVVMAEREVPTQEVDPAWFMCPRATSCVATLGRPGASEPCTGVVPEDVACRLPDGDRPQFVAPALDPETPLEDQTFFQIAMVGHVDEGMTTEECVELVSAPSTEDWSGCLVGYRGITLGPALRLATHAIDLGMAFPENPVFFVNDPVHPPFNPEVIPLTLFPYHGGLQFDLSRAITVRPGETTTLEPGIVYAGGSYWDPKEIQPLAIIGPLGLSTEVSLPSRSLFTSAPDVLDFSFMPGWQIWAPEEPGSFEVRFVLHDQAGGTAWETFNFEVAEP
ncbi:MAG: hypothetical protein ACRBN8_23775 [Nannocystales bacterium]